MSEAIIDNKVKRPLIVISESEQPLSEIAKYYDVVEYHSVKDLQRHLYQHVPQFALVFTNDLDPPSYLAMLPGFAVIIITNDTNLLSQRWSGNTGIFDIIDNDTLFADPVRRLYVYHALQSIIDKYKNKASASDYSIYMELYDATRKSDEATGNHHQNSIRLLYTLYKALIDSDTKLYGESMYEDITAAILHDVGKLFVPKNILLKPGKLTNSEFAVVKNHTTDGRFIVHRLSMELPQISGLHKHIPSIELHHERWDGSGYPYGLMRDQIPLPVRLMTIMDVYEALIARRPYKDPMPHDKAVSIIKEGAGTHFDPSLVKVFQKASGDLEALIKTS